MDNIRVGLVGIGGMGGCHFDNYKNVKGATLVSVCDVRVDMAQKRVGEGDIKVYGDLDTMLANEKLDMIDICTPSYLHADMAVKCLEKGYHVLCEKPMTLTKKDAERVLEASKKTNKNFMVAHVVRFMAPYVVLRNAIQSGEFGKLLRLDLKRISSIPTWSWEDWMRDEKRSGGVTIDLSIHDIDYVQSILGKPDKASAVLRPIKDNSSFVQSTMIYGETLVNCEGTWYNTDIPFNANYRAVFENGFVEFKDWKVYKNGKEVEIEKTEDDGKDLGINIGNDNGYLNEIQYFVDCIVKGEKPSFVTPESSAYSITLCEELVNKATII